MTAPAFSGAGAGALAAGGVADGVLDDGGGAGDGADAGGAVAVAGEVPAGAAIARVSDAASAHEPDKSVAIAERGGRGTVESYRKSRKRTAAPTALCTKQ